MQGNSPKTSEDCERRENEVELELEGSLALTLVKDEECLPAAGDSLSAPNRWPQQETLALLRIRSHMDAVFRQSCNKAPLWDLLSRKMAELGYDRSAKKCKEKFDNIYKYHKRLKNCSYSRPTGKTYRFFDQLEALDHHQASVQTSLNFDSSPQVPMLPSSVNFDSSPITTSTSISYTSGSEFEGSRKKKRKWVDFFQELMKSVLTKQEDLQNNFLEAIDRCENERMAREEEWKAQEMARIKREQELLMQERAISAAKDAAILAFLQKVIEQGKDPSVLGQTEINGGPEMSIVHRNERDPGDENPCSRWPKEEVEALIRIRSSIELNDQGGGSKGPLWEEISMAMNNMGYKRSAKRCKEKWENINKYYRRVRDSNKQRPVASKTCPYFHLLDALYSMKTKKLDSSNSSEAVCNLRPEELLMHMHMMNHDRSGQMQEQELLQQENGQLMITAQESSHNENHSRNEHEDEDEHVEYEQGDYQSAARYPSHTE